MSIDKDEPTKVHNLCSSQPMASTSQQATATVVGSPSTSEKLDKLTQLLSGFIEIFTHSEGNIADNSGVAVQHPHDISSSEGELTYSDYNGNDPLDGLDDVFSLAQPSTSDQQGVFQSALYDLASSFYGEEEKGEALSDELANILNQSLRHCPSDDSVKATSAKIKLPANVENMKVPVTNTDISQFYEYWWNIFKCSANKNQLPHLQSHCAYRKINKRLWRKEKPS